MSKELFLNIFRKKYPKYCNEIDEKSRNKTLTKKEWNKFTEFIDKEYENYPNKVNIKSMADVKKFKKDTIEPRLKQLI